MNKASKMRLAQIFMRFSGVIALLMCVLLGAISLVIYKKDVTQLYYDTAATAVSLAMEEVNGDDVAEGIQKNEMTDALKEDLELINSIKRSSNIAYLYMVYFPDQNNKSEMRYVMFANIDRDRELGQPDSVINAPAGTEYSQEMWDAFYKIQFSGSDEMQYMINQYQSPMITAFKTVYDSAGNPVCVIGADIFAEIMSEHVRSYIFYVAAFGCIVLILGVMGFRLISRQYIMKPVMELLTSTENFLNQTKIAEVPEDIDITTPEIKADTELRDLAYQLSDMMNGTKDYMINLRTVTKESERIGTELQVATNIQRDLLPSIFPPYPERKEFDVYGYMHPAKEVGGDFYDFFFIDHDHFAMVIADVSGKGVPAALFMVITKTLINNQVQMTGLNDLSGSLEAVSNKLCESNSEEMFVTVWLAIVDLKTGDGVSINAGHEHPALRRKNGQYELIKYPHSPAVAVMEGIKFKEHQFHLDPGDSIYVYTDGVPEATDDKNELFGEQRLVKALNKDSNASMEKLFNNVIGDVREFVGDAPQFDDMTMMGFRYNGPVEEEP